MSSLNAIQQLEKQAAIYVKNLVDEFKENPTSRRFDNIIPPPRTGKNIEDFFIPRFLYGAPQIITESKWCVQNMGVSWRLDVLRTKWKWKVLEIPALDMIYLEMY